MKRAGELTPAWRAALGVADPSAWLNALLEAPDLRALPGDWELLSKPGLRGRERWRWRPSPQSSEVVYLKRYHRVGWRAQWDRWWRQSRCTSRAAWEFRQCVQLREANIGAPPGVAFAEVIGLGVERRSFVALGAVPGEAFDRRWRAATQCGAPITRGAARHDVVRRLARFIAAFHQSGRCHRDLYLCHVFAILDDAAQSAPCFALIDLARVHFPWLRRRRWVLKDLSQLDASARPLGATRTDRLRFLAAYLSLAPRTPLLREYARGVVQRSDRILRQIARRAARSAIAP